MKRRKRKRKLPGGRRKWFFFWIFLIFFWVYYETGSSYKTGEEKSFRLFSVPSYDLCGFMEEHENIQNRIEEDSGDTVGEQKVTEGDKIRVLIKTQNFLSFYHEKLQITSSSPYIVRQNGNDKRYSSGEKLTFSLRDLRKKTKTIQIFPEKNGRLKILSFKRMGHHPAYRGRFRITMEKKGLLLINEVSLEEYLYAVVSSEISTSSPVEALKAQAICARTYAQNKQKASEYEKYGADLDDSDSCQVYNNIPEDKRSRRAVNETEGLVLKHNGKRIPVYYFSTSWGYTASGKEVWNTGEKIPYLLRKFQMTDTERAKKGDVAPDLSGEKAFRTFLEENPYETYDSSSPWYRWHIRVSWKEFERKIEGKVRACYEAYPNLVLFREKSTGKYIRGQFRELGDLKEVRVAKRDKSGLVTELMITGEKNSVKIKTQYSIRRLLSLSDDKIILKDGSTHTAFSLLPSAAFYLEKRNKGNKEYLFIFGGGFGHGTGMSQWGAGVQAEEGWSCEKILKYYFSGIAIEPGR